MINKKLRIKPLIWMILSFFHYFIKEIKPYKVWYSWSGSTSICSNSVKYLLIHAVLYPKFWAPIISHLLEETNKISSLFKSNF